MTDWARNCRTDSQALSTSRESSIDSTMILNPCRSAALSASAR